MIETTIFSKRRAKNRRLTTRMRPRLEALEGRVVLSTFHVNTTLDTVAANFKTGQDAAGHISLRSAIMAANAKPNSDTIILPRGTFTLTIPGRGEDNDATGDLDIRGNLAIKGKGAGSTIIDGNNLDRVFQIFSGKVTISGVTIQDGLAMGDGGGGILNSGGNVTLSSVTLSNNEALGIKGANGETGADGSAIGGNGLSGLAGTLAEGGGIFNAIGAPLRISGTTIASNAAAGGLGGAGSFGIYTQGSGGGADTKAVPGAGGNGSGGHGGIAGAGGSGAGGGLANLGSVTFSGKASTFLGNLAVGNDGGTGGDAAEGVGGTGGSGASGGENGGEGGAGAGGDAAAGGSSGSSYGGGIYNGFGASLVSTVALTFNQNRAVSLAAGMGGVGGRSLGGGGGNGGPFDQLTNPDQAEGGAAQGGKGGSGGVGGSAFGGGLCNAGTVIMEAPTQARAAITSSFVNNDAAGGAGGAGGEAGSAAGGNGGNGVGGASGAAGNGGLAVGGRGGNGGPGGAGLGGGLYNFVGATLSLTGITVNLESNAAFAEVLAALGGDAGEAGAVSGGIGGSSGGANGHLIDGSAGAQGAAGAGLGGGAALGGTSTISNTPITGNHAATGDNDEDNNFSDSNVPN